MFLPSMPAMAQQFQSTPGHMQLTVTLFIVALAISQLIFGPLSDRFGRRPTMLTGLALYALAGFVCVFAPTLEFLIFGRILQGLAAGSGPAISRAIVRDIYGKARSAQIMSYMATAMALAPISAPILGGFLQAYFGWQSVFYILGLMGALFFLTFVFVVPESNTQIDTKALQLNRLFGNYTELLSNRQYIGNTLLTTMLFCGILAFLANSSFVLIDTLGLSPKVYGFCFGTVAFGVMVGAFTSGRLSKRIDHSHLITVGTLISSGAGLLMAALALAGIFNVFTIIGPLFLFTTGGGMLRPLAMAAAIIPFPEKAGLASALMGFIQMFSAGIFAIIFGHTYGGTAMPMIAAIALSGMAALLVNRFMLNKKQ
jgi:MFS transporter, DHA1 family, multidrug resistance protein